MHVYSLSLEIYIVSKHWANHHGLRQLVTANICRAYSVKTTPIPLSSGSAYLEGKLWCLLAMWTCSCLGFFEFSWRPTPLGKWTPQATLTVMLRTGILAANCVIIFKLYLNLLIWMASLIECAPSEHLQVYSFGGSYLGLQSEHYRRQQHNVCHKDKWESWTQ